MINSLVILTIYNIEIRYFNNVELYRQIPFLNFASYNLLSKIIIFLWTIFITIGIWRSAEAYKGKIIWMGPASDIDKTKNEVLKKFIKGDAKGLSEISIGTD